MPKGSHHASDFEHALAEFFGGIRIQIVFFAAETGFSADRIAEGISTLLSPTREGILHQLPAVQRETTGARGPMEPLALAEHAHSSQASPTIEARRGPSNQKSYWSRMTKQERKVEMERRLAVAHGKARPIEELRKARAKPGKPLTEAERKARDAQRHRVSRAKGKSSAASPAKNKHRNTSKQHIYQARHEAKKAGLPLPPLPSESASAAA